MARILVVDDEEGIRILFCLHLHGAGQDVYQAAGGREGVLQALLSDKHGQPTDLLVTDLHMPKVDGMDMIAAMAYARCLPERVIMLSGDFVDPGKAEACRQKIRLLVPPTVEFNFQVLAKPIPENQFLYVVGHMLADRVE